jgi:hypothetical protein
MWIIKESLKSKKLKERHDWKIKNNSFRRIDIERKVLRLKKKKWW